MKTANYIQTTNRITSLNDIRVRSVLIVDTNINIYLKKNILSNIVYCSMIINKAVRQSLKDNFYLTKQFYIVFVSK